MKYAVNTNKKLVELRTELAASYLCKWDREEDEKSRNNGIKR